MATTDRGGPARAGHLRGAAAHHRPYRRLCLLALVPLTLALASCGGRAPQGGDGATQPAASADGAAAAVATRQVRAVIPSEGALQANRSTSVTIEPGREAQVAAGTSGRVASILRREGSQVTAGETVVQLDDAALRTQASSARLALETARVNLEKADKASGEGAQQAQAGLETAKANLDLAQRQLDSGEQLYQAGGISATDLEGLRAQYAQAQSAYGQAQDGLARAKRAGGEDLALLRLQVQQAQNQLEQAQRSVRDAAVTAPFPGEVAEVKVEEGEFVGAGTPVFRLVSTKQQLARFDVPPQDAQALTAQGQLWISYAGLDYGAHIVRSSEVPGASRLVEITAEIYPSEARIPTGSVAQLNYTIDLARGQLLPSGAIQPFNGNDTVLLARDGEAQRVTVQVLAEAGAQVAVAGLAADARVIYPVPADLRAGIPVRIVTGDGGAP